MKEISADTAKPVNANPKGIKKWITAHAVSKGNEQLKIQNRIAETDCHRVIAAVKNLYAQAGMQVTVFERDYKHDRSDGLFSMHSFVTPHFYWSLSCELTHNYIIEYDFSGCPFEDEIKALLRAYPLDRVAIHKPRQPSFTAFYKRVLQVQDKQYQSILKPNSVNF